MLIENKKSTEHDITFRNIYYFSSRDITHALASEVLLLQFYIHTTLLFSAFRHRTVANTLLVNRNPAVLQHVEIAMSAHSSGILSSTYACHVLTRTGALVPACWRQLLEVAMRRAVRFFAWVLIVPIGPFTVIYFPFWACYFRFFLVLTRSSLMYTSCICFQNTIDEGLSEEKTNQDGNREHRKHHCAWGFCLVNDYECCRYLRLYLYRWSIFDQSIKIMISILILHTIQNKLTCFTDNLKTQKFIKCYIAISVCICWSAYIGVI